MISDSLKAQHAKMMGLVRELATGTSTGSRAEAAAGMRDKLNKLSGILTAHLAVEDEVVYPRLAADPRPQVREMAARFQKEMGGLKKAFTDYAGKWSRDRIAADLAGFGAETKTFLDALSARIGREEHELYPAADAAR